MKWLGLKASPAQCATIMLLYNKMDKALAGVGIINESIFEIVEDEKLQDVKKWLEEGSPEIQESLSLFKCDKILRFMAVQEECPSNTERYR